MDQKTRAGIDIESYRQKKVLYPFSIGDVQTRGVNSKNHTSQNEEMTIDNLPYSQSKTTTSLSKHETKDSKVHISVQTEKIFYVAKEDWDIVNFIQHNKITKQEIENLIEANKRDNDDINHCTAKSDFQNIVDTNRSYEHGLTNLQLTKNHPQQSDNNDNNKTYLLTKDKINPENEKTRAAANDFSELSKRKKIEAHLEMRNHPRQSEKFDGFHQNKLHKKNKQGRNYFPHANVGTPNINLSIRSQPTQSQQLKPYSVNKNNLVSEPRKIVRRPKIHGSISSQSQPMQQYVVKQYAASYNYQDTWRSLVAQKKAELGSVNNHLQMPHMQSNRESQQQAEQYQVPHDGFYQRPPGWYYQH